MRSPWFPAIALTAAATTALVGPTAPTVEIRRNGVVVATTLTDVAYADSLGRVPGTYRYRVSHPAGTPISNEVPVTF